ncbi:MAG: hypothetical protein R2708_13305 [Vicinamibacterales bacterium]
MTWTTAITAGQAAVAAAWLTGALGALPAAAQETAGEIFSADVTIEDSIVDDNGVVTEARPATRFRVIRRRVAGGVETEIAYPEARLFDRGPLADPRGGQRVVFAPGGGARIYDAAGTLLATLNPGDAQPDAGVGEPMAFADRHRRLRADTLRGRLGRPVGRHGGRDRYLATDGDATTETLVEPDSMLPVEVNVVREGVLSARTELRYGRMPGGRWYLASTRSESALGDGTGRRLVSVRTHTNVAGSEGR